MASSPALIEREARRRFLRGEKLQIDTLADALGTSRATAYRWAGGNVDELTGRVIAQLMTDTFERCKKEARGRGAKRIREIITRGTRYMATSKPYTGWVRTQDPQTALRIVASKHGPVQATTIRLFEQLVAEEIERGYRPPVDAHTMAYAVVRLTEAFLYADIISGEEPDLDTAIEALKLLVPD